MSTLVPLAGVCLSRETSIDHVHALVEAGVLAPPKIAQDGLEIVPGKYLDEIDEGPDA